MGARFWLRWSWRDLRRRAPQVLAIATIIALGAGIFAGLSSTSVWRRRSLDASFRRLAGHDLEVALVGGAPVDGSRLTDAIEAAGGPAVAVVEPRVLAGVPATAKKGSVESVAAGELVGTDLSNGPRIDRWRVVAGRDLSPADAGRPIVLLDVHFAREHGLPPAGTISIGNAAVRYVGLALAPEYLDLNTTAGEAIQGQATRAVMFTSIETARGFAHLPAGIANDAVVRVAPGANVARVADRVSRSLASALPATAVTVTARDDDPSVRALYDEIDSEQRIFDVFALLILAGAGFAAFNLTKRVVEAQRRDIGIAMSLGLPPARIAIRIMLFAVEIIVLGVALGALVGWVIGTWVLSVIRARAPLPYWETPFQVGLFLRAAALGLVIPLLASALPVWRAVHVQPVDALVPGHLRGNRSRLARLVRRVRLPGTTTFQTPLRRIVRAPSRSVLTIGAIALIMAPLLAAFGATDSVSATIDAGERVLTGHSGDRLLVGLTTYQSTSSPVIESIRRAPGVHAAAPGLNTGGYLMRGTTKIGVSLSMVDLQSTVAAPAPIAARRLPPGGIVISAKAARDLHVGTGDPITLRHPQQQGIGYRFVDTRLPVSAVVASPYRFVAYMDIRDETIMGLEGIANTVKVQPRAGASMEQLQREIAAMPGVASAIPARALSTTMRALMAVVGRLFIILQVVIALLAFLVAFNSANIGSDERAREHATMFAFGIRIRRVLLLLVAESFLLGVVGVALGLGLGAAILHWILDTVFPAAVPDLAVLQAISTTSYLVTVGIGLLAVAAAPLLSARRLRTTNIPNTLRYVE